MPRERNWVAESDVHEFEVSTVDYASDGRFTIWLTDRSDGTTVVLNAAEARELGRALIGAANEIGPEVSDAA